MKCKVCEKMQTEEYIRLPCSHLYPRPTRNRVVVVCEMDGCGREWDIKWDSGSSWTARETERG